MRPRAGLALLPGKGCVDGLPEGQNLIKVSRPKSRSRIKVKAIGFTKWLEQPGGSQRDCDSEAEGARDSGNACGPLDVRLRFVGVFFYRCTRYFVSVGDPGFKLQLPTPRAGYAQGIPTHGCPLAITTRIAVLNHFRQRGTVSRRFFSSIKSIHWWRLRMSCRPCSVMEYLPTILGMVILLIFLIAAW
jgi:hypothetical protein